MDDEDFPEGCPDCGQDSLALADADDADSVYCTNPRCGYRF